MSEPTQYFNAFRTGYWATADIAECPCRGSGWALSEVDTWHECPAHFTGQRHPESDACCADPQVRGGRCLTCDTWLQDVKDEPPAEQVAAKLDPDDILF